MWKVTLEGTLEVTLEVAWPTLLWRVWMEVGWLKELYPDHGLLRALL